MIEMRACGQCVENDFGLAYKILAFTVGCFHSRFKAEIGQAFRSWLVVFGL